MTSMLGVFHDLLMKKICYFFLFFLRSVVFRILLMAVSLWTSNQHSVEGVWCLWSWPTFSSQTFPNECLCSRLINSLYVLERHGINCVFPNCPKASASEDGKSTEDRLDLTSWTDSSSDVWCWAIYCLPHRGLHIEGDHASRLYSIIPAA